MPVCNEISCHARQLTFDRFRSVPPAVALGWENGFTTKHNGVHLVRPGAPICNRPRAKQASAWKLGLDTLRIGPEIEFGAICVAVFLKIHLCPVRQFDTRKLVDGLRV